MRKVLSVGILFIVFGRVNAQQPVITSIDPTSSYPSSRLTISGSGFGTDASNLVVWFGSVRATITKAEDNLLQVQVPPQASADNITVVHLTSGLVSQSDEKFFPFYSGAAFDPIQMGIEEIFSDPGTYENVYDPCACDLDGDNKPDVVVTKTAGANNEIIILHNQSTLGGPLSFLPQTNNIGYATRNIRCGDLDGDGKPDLYMSRDDSRFNLIVLKNISSPGSIAFSTLPPLPMQTTVKTRRVNHKDLNGDGRPDLVVTNSEKGEVIVFENTSSGGTISFDPASYIPVSGATSTSGLDIQDIDGDGKPDIIVNQFFDSDIFVLENTSTGGISFAEAHQLTSASTLVNLTTGDFDNDGLLDIAASDNTNDEIVVFKNQSTTEGVVFESPQSFAVNAGPWGLTTGDMNGDGLLDIITTSIESNMASVLMNESSATVGFNKIDVNVGKPSRNLAVNDLDGDAKPDLVVTASEGTTNFDIRLIRNKNCYQPVFLNETPLAICDGQTLTLKVPPSPGVTFSWTKDGTSIGNNIDTLEITAFGDYVVTATAEGGNCSTNANITVSDGNGEVPGDPNASNTGPACLGGELTLMADPVPGATYKWTGPDNFTSTDQNPVISNITYDMAGIYTVIIKLGDCLSSESETVVDVVTIPEFNTIPAGATEVCAPNTVSLSTEDRGTDYSYQWLKDGVDIAGETTTSYTATASGIYNVRIDDLGSDCQVLTPEIKVGIYSPPAVDFDAPASGCAGTEIVFTDNSVVDPSAPVIYNWNFGENATSTSTDQHPVYTYTAGGDYTVQLDISYSGITGCTDMLSKGIVIKDPVEPVIESAESTMCPGGDLELNVQGIYSDILWNTSETTSSITVHAPGTYRVTVTDANGCPASSDIVIGSKDVPDITAQVIPDPADTIITEGSEVQLEATGAVSYSWSPGNSLSDSTVANPVASPLQTTTYIVTGKSSDGCSAAAEITITITATGEINITPMKAFSPNSTLHPYWEIQNVLNYPECTLSIYNEKGSLVFREKGYANDWNATYNGGNLPEGVYYYVFAGEGFNPKTGSVLVVR